MTRTATTTIAALAALAWLPPSTGAASAQETTVQEVLEYLQREERVKGVLDYEPAVWILRQLDRWGDSPYPRTSAELDAFADRLAAMVLDTALPRDVRSYASYALAVAADTADDRGGTPYPRAFDLLVEVYEGGYGHALSTIWWADPVRGPAYVRELFERSERPPVCDPGMWRGTAPECVDGPDTFHDTPWCRAGGVLYDDALREAHATLVQRAREGIVVTVPEGMPGHVPEHVEEYWVRCEDSGWVF